MLFPLFLAAACLLGPPVHALVNVSVDQSDPTISYSGQWNLQIDPMDVGGNHLLAEYDVNAAAAFTFVGKSSIYTVSPVSNTCLASLGVAVYFVSPKWPYRVTTDLSLDGGPIVRLDLQDQNHEVTDGGLATVPSAPIPDGSWTGLDNVQHTLRVTVPPGHDWAVLDTIIYTQPESSDPGFVPGGSGSGGDSGTGGDGSGNGGDGGVPGGGGGAGGGSGGSSGGIGTSTGSIGSPSSTASTASTGVSSRPTGSATASGSNSSPSVSPISGTASDSGNNRRLAIALGVVFGLVGLAILLALFLLLRRRRRRQEARRALLADTRNMGPEAITSSHPPYPPRGPDAQPLNQRDPFSDPIPEPAFVPQATATLLNARRNPTGNPSVGPERASGDRGPQLGHSQHEPALVPRPVGSDPDVA